MCVLAIFTQWTSIADEEGTHVGIMKETNEEKNEEDSESWAASWFDMLRLTGRGRGFEEEVKMQ